MADIDCSPSDPIFFMHHNYVDRVWLQWQKVNASGRMFEMSGYKYNISWLEQYGPADAIETLTKDAGILTTLDYQLEVAISKAVNAHGGLLCYEYNY
jgi:tyrosinase